MTLSFERLAFATLVASLLVFHDARASADEPPRSAENMATARDALLEGLALREKGDIEGAFARLHLAHTLVATPVTAYELGKTHMMRGELLSARELFLEVTRLPRSLEESERSEVARRESARLVDELEPHIPRLNFKLVLPPGATAVVKVDGVVVTHEAVTAPRRVNPGAHEVTAKAGDGPEQKVHVEIKENESKDVDLAPQWVAPKEAPKPERAYYVKSSPKAIPLYMGVGFAALGLVGGTTAFVTGKVIQSSALDKCQDKYCPQYATQSDLNTAANYGAGAVIGYAAAGAGVMLIIYSVLFPNEEKVYTGIIPTVGPGSAGLQGTF
jgi:hypothetical protein